MSKKSKWETRSRNMVCDLLKGEAAMSLAQVAARIAAERDGRKVDVLILNTNHLLDLVCQKNMGMTRNRTLYSHVANDCVNYIVDIMSLFCPTNVVITTDGALPYAAWKGVKVDNCNSEAFHRQGQAWAGGNGWDRPYPFADMLLGQAFSPGSQMYTYLHAAILDLVKANMPVSSTTQPSSQSAQSASAYTTFLTLSPSVSSYSSSSAVSAASTAFLYMPHTEYSSWEKKGPGMLGIMENSIVGLRTSGSKILAVVLDVSTELTHRMILNPTVDAILVYQSFPFPDRSSLNVLWRTNRSHRVVFLDQAMEVCLKTGEEAAGFVIYSNMILGSQWSPPLSGSTGSIISGDATSFAFARGWDNVRTKCSTFRARGSLHMSELGKFLSATVGAIEWINGPGTSMSDPPGPPSSVGLYL